MEGGAVRHNFERDTPRDHLCQVWLHLAKLLGSSSGRVKSEIYNIGTCGFSARHAALSSKNKEWLARNQHNVSE
jgi:hypothetical protein